MSNSKEKLIALVATIIGHALLVVLLFFVYMTMSAQDEQSSAPVDIGNIEVAMGSDMDSWSQALPKPRKAMPTPAPAPEKGEPEELLTQEHEDAPPMAPVPPPKKSEKPKVREPKPKPAQKTPTPKVEDPRKVEEARLKAQEEARLKAEQALREQEEQKRKAAQSRVANAFQGAKDSEGSRGSGTFGSGVQGSPTGNVSSGGAGSGVGGYGSWNLSGRGLIGGQLPVPQYTSQTEGRIVISITVDPKGNVISASIGPGTNIDNHTMRQKALEAARRAKFTATDGIQNQEGSITYIYKLRS
ncbi:MAG: cell envelope integrity protein TolA [Porphyromonas sp.]|nr:cell envelope integrity protein TolA [Porphyromonas sp.]